MPPRGTKPKPLEVRAAEGGTVRKGAVSHRPVVQAVQLSPRLLSAPPPPASLTSPDAVELWESEAVQALFEHGVMTVADVPALTLMCQHYGDYAEARAVLDKQGRFAYGSTGQMIAHPAIAILEKSSMQFLRYAGEFGMTPTARTRVGLMDAARRTLNQDLHDRLGSNPRLVDEETK